MKPPPDLGQDDTRAEIRARAMDLLARREHAPMELRNKLQQRGHAPEDVDPVLAELAIDGLLSEERYAEALVTARCARGYGPLRIRSELSRMQIDEALCERVLAQQDIDWFTLAASACVKRFGTQPPGDYRERAKRMRFLQQRGFDFDCIHAAVEGG